MQQPAITFILNGTSYRLCATDTQAIRELPAADRSHLITLLEAVKREDKLSRAAVDNAAEHSAAASTYGPGVRVPAKVGGPKPERLGSGDVDALMARLIMEEKRDQKPGLTKQGIYKVVAGFVVVIFALVLLL